MCLRAIPGWREPRVARVEPGTGRPGAAPPLATAPGAVAGEVLLVIESRSRAATRSLGWSEVTILSSPMAASFWPAVR